MKNGVIILCLLISFQAQSSRVDKYSYKGIAKNQAGEVLYEEFHTEFIKNGRVDSVVTEYKNQAGKNIALLETNLRKNLRSPEHTFTDYRYKESHGLKWEGDQLIIFSQEEKKMKRLKYNIQKNSVGGQGFHFYILSKMSEWNSKSSEIFDFIIPGKLDSYDFALSVKENNDKKITFVVEIDNWFLSMFAPSLLVEYDKKRRVLTRYEGLSNLKDKNGDVQRVIITYEHPKEINSRTRLLK